MAKYTIVMVRHGESEWNQKNLFCGWYDANLSTKGKSNKLTKHYNITLFIPIPYIVGLGQCISSAELDLTWMIKV